MLDETPAAFAWADLVDHVVRTEGGWAKTADELARRLRLAGVDAPDLGTIEKGLRRLHSRSGDSGGQYGRWLIRHFGVPSEIENQLRWMAQYHSRFGDLPTSLRLQHLRLFDRPPVSESSLIVWIHVGMASAHHRRQQTELCQQRLTAAQSKTSSAEPLARLEVGLLAARIASDGGDIDGARQRLADLEPLLNDDDLEHMPYRARLNGQQAFQLTRSSPDDNHLESARQLFLNIASDTGIPFVDYRRTAGLAFCAWRLGNISEGRRLAQLAGEHAGDGGLIRFRVMALNLLSKMSSSAEAVQLRARAKRLADSIEDFHLAAVATRR